jgi:hypothetical protein
VYVKTYVWFSDSEKSSTSQRETSQPSESSSASSSQNQPSLESPRRQKPSLAEKKGSFQAHNKRQQFQKFKSKSIKSKKNVHKFVRQNSLPNPFIVVTQHY